MPDFLSNISLSTKIMSASTVFVSHQFIIFLVSLFLNLTISVAYPTPFSLHTNTYDCIFVTASKSYIHEWISIRVYEWIPMNECPRVKYNLNNSMNNYIQPIHYFHFSFQVTGSKSSSLPADITLKICIVLVYSLMLYFCLSANARRKNLSFLFSFCFVLFIVYGCQFVRVNALLLCLINKKLFWKLEFIITNWIL